MRRAAVLMGVLSIAAFAWLQWSRAAPRRPNVLVIVWDTVRADRTSLHGHSRPTTPRLEQFARGATMFEQARSPGIWTLPSHAAMFTGLPPQTTGADERWLWLDGHHHTLAEHFSSHGYATFSMAANALLCRETNLVQGFRATRTTYRGAPAAAARQATRAKRIAGDRSHELTPDWRPPAHGATNAEWARAEFKDAAPLIGDVFLRWLDERPDPEAPFFAFLNLMEAHTPRMPSAAARSAVIGDPGLIARGLDTDASHIRLHFYNFGVERITAPEVEAIRAVYDATLHDLDTATGVLLDALTDRGDLVDTIVVITSDHGESLGEHHLFNHRFALWDTLTHVPLVIRLPGRTPGRVSAPVGTIDLFATLSRAAGLPVPPDIVSGDLFGEPSPVVTTMELPLRREIATVSAVHPEVESAPWLRTGDALVVGSHKLIDWSTGERELYDLLADPQESAPVVDPDRTARLVAQLAAWRLGVRPPDPTLRGPKDRPARVRANQEELRAHLEALGYATGAAD